MLQKFSLTCSILVEQTIRRDFSASRLLGPLDHRVWIAAWCILEWFIDINTTGLISAGDPWIISVVTTCRSGGCSFCICFSTFSFAVGHLWNPPVQWDSLLLSTFLEELVWRMFYWYLTGVFLICAALVGLLHIPYKSDRFRHQSTISVFLWNFQMTFGFRFLESFL